MPGLTQCLPLARGVGRILIAASLFCAAPPAASQPREKCAQDRQQAEGRYLEGQFDAAIERLRACLNREVLFADEAVAVYRLLGLSFLNKGDLEQARRAVSDLLDVMPGYEADPVQDPPSYTALVNLVRGERRSAQQPEPLPPEPPVTGEPPEQARSFPGGAKTWLLATGGAVVVFAAALLAFGKSAESGGQP